MLPKKTKAEIRKEEARKKEEQEKKKEEEEMSIMRFYQKNLYSTMSKHQISQSFEISFRVRRTLDPKLVLILSDFCYLTFIALEDHDVIDFLTKLPSKKVAKQMGRIKLKKFNVDYDLTTSGCLFKILRNKDLSLLKKFKLTRNEYEGLRSKAREAFDLHSRLFKNGFVSDESDFSD